MKFVTAGLLVILMVSTVAADWTDDFRELFSTRNIEVAVEESLKQGATPEAIIEFGGQIEGMQLAEVIKALYCVGLSGGTIHAAANSVGVPESEVVVGYRQSVQQCGPAAALSPDPFSRTLDIAAKGSPVGGGGEFPGIPPGTGGGTPPVILPPVDGGGGITRPPSVSPARP